MHTAPQLAAWKAHRETQTERSWTCLIEVLPAVDTGTLRMGYHRQRACKACKACVQGMRARMSQTRATVDTTKPFLTATSY